MGNFFKAFCDIFFGGMLGIIYADPDTLGNRGGVIGSLVQMFDFGAYAEVYNLYKPDMTSGQIAGAIICFILVVLVLAALLFCAIFFGRKLVKRIIGDKILNQDLIVEIDTLRKELVKITKEKDRILGLKIAYQGYDILEGNEGEDTSSEKKEGESRFYKLTEVDNKYADPEFKEREYECYDLTLEQICDRFRNYAANNPDRPWRHLYYEPKIVRLFFSSLATTRLIILQGISGTGKTSLPECLGHFLKNDTTIASVQPSWRDRTELFGYFNEFTKRFNETEVLKAMYDATYNKDVYITVLDEMNIARVEYYFAEMLSILEMPSRDQWVVDLVPSGWPSDPKHVEKGLFRLPENLWYVGTANNDDSTFAISDKVYDRAMIMNLDAKSERCAAPSTSKKHISAAQFEDMVQKAQKEYALSSRNMRRLEELDKYLIEHFHITFGNRIMKQIKTYIPVYVSCGGEELAALDDILAKKVIRKLETQNPIYLRNTAEGLISHMEELFGNDGMPLCKEYIRRLERNA